MAKNKTKEFNPRVFMELAISEMHKSIQEPRQDKVSPKVGAILIMPNGETDTAYRGELRHGDHAEFTLLERKHRSDKVDGSILFATLEPCAPGARKHPKLGCAERIVNARIKKVYIGIEDPDPSVDRKGIQFLIDNGIEVEMFDADLQKVIREANKQFIEEAEDRAKQVQEKFKEVLLSDIEKVAISAIMPDLSEEKINKFISLAKLNVDFGSQEFNHIFKQLGLLEGNDNKLMPTGIGLLLFGKRPQLIYQNALLRATYKTKNRGEKLKTIEGPIIAQADDAMEWFKEVIDKQTDRSDAQREDVYDYPLVVIREAVVNAIVHRDYDIQGAPIYLEVNDEAIVVKSPGYPVKPIKLEQIQKFNAPSLSRNPKIMYVFDQLELVEQRGLGFETIKELPTKYGLPLPIITYEDPYLIFSFPRTMQAVLKISESVSLTELNKEQLKGYEWLRSVREASTREYSAHFDIGYKTAQRHLAKMKELNLIEDTALDINSPNYKYKVK
jgi:ATP-dependent DNA helicase RecG